MVPSCLPGVIRHHPGDRIYHVKRTIQFETKTNHTPNLSIDCYPEIKFISIPWNLLGLLFLGTGIGISYAAEAQFHRVNTSVKPFVKSTALVTDGMFKFSRNPMYLGFACILLGVAILLGSWDPMPGDSGLYRSHRREVHSG